MFGIKIKFIVPEGNTTLLVNNATLQKTLYAIRLTSVDIGIIRGLPNAL
jgi:hypothetical protein